MSNSNSNSSKITFTKKWVISAVSLSVVFLLFQNCSNKLDTVEMDNFSSVTPLGSSSDVVSTPTGPVTVGTGSTGQQIQYIDSSIGDGNIIHRFVQQIKGVGNGELRACASLASNITGCASESEFRVLRNQTGWSYNSSTDIYSINQDVTSMSLPFGRLLFRLILPNGERKEVSIMPIKFVDESEGNGTYSTRWKQTVVGLTSSNIMACSGRVTDTTPCTLIPLSTAKGWQYNQSTDTWSLDTNASFTNFPSLGYPDTNAYTLYKTPNGLTTEIRWKPKRTVASPPTVTCQWSSGQAVAGPCSAPRTTCNQSTQGQTIMINCAAPQVVVTTCRCQ